MAADANRLAAALDYLERIKRQAVDFGGGVASNLAERAKSAGGLAFEALTSDPNIGRMTTAEFSQAAADRQTPRLDQAAQDIGTIGRAIVTQPIQTGKAIVQGEIERAQGAMQSPRAAGEYAGSFIDPVRMAAALRKTGPVMAELDVYHGTPHRFPATEANPLGEFDASKIGTGEGAQAYGHGVYYAENPEVAKGYQPRDPKAEAKLMNLYKQAEARQNYDAMEVLEAAMLHRTASELREQYPNQKALVNRIGKINEKAAGALYKADLPDEMIDRMLDWDKPLSEQSVAVKEMLRKSPLAPDESVWPQWTGQQFYEAEVRAMTEFDKLQKGPSRASVSDAIRQTGIPGIKYADAGSRGQGGSGTRNFVVFPGEEKKVRILERDGQKAPPQKIAQALEATKPVRVQAKAGGEVAESNGYFYKGGQFLPSTEAEPGRWKIGKKVVTTKQEVIAPGEMAVQPTPFSRSIYQAALGQGDWVTKTPEGLKVRENIKTSTGEPITPDMKIRLGVKGVLGKEELTLQEFVDAYNKGQRWFDVQPDAPVVRSK